MMSTRGSSLPSIEERSLTEAKVFKVFKNGDRWFPGRKYVLNTKAVPNMEAFYRDVNNLVRLNGPIYRVYTPTQGHRVTDYNALESDKVYVCGGNESFKRLDYTQIDSSSPRRRNRSKNSYDRLQPGHHNKMFESVHSKFSEVPIQGKNIDVFYNKNGVERPTTIGITPKQLRSLDDTIKAIHEAIGKKHLCKVEELYDTEGNLITDVRQIENGHQYVAKDKTGIFDRGPYNPNGMKNMMVPVHSPRSQPRYLWKERSTATFGRRDERPRTLPPIQKKNSPDHSVSSYPETRKRNQVNGVPQKPAKHTKRNNRQADYDKDDGGVFKAKGQSKDTRGAREVRDTGDTKVDLPIDQVRAEEVKDEKIRKDKQSKDTEDKGKKPLPPIQSDKKPGTDSKPGTDTINKPPDSSPSKPGGDVKPADTKPSSDVKAPGNQTSKPPAPGDTKPSTDSKPNAASTKQPPGDNKPPANNNLPPGDSKPPANKPPTGDNKQPASNQPPAGDSKAPINQPAGDGKGPANQGDNKPAGGTKPADGESKPNVTNTGPASGPDSNANT